MRPKRRITMIAAGVLLIASTPLVWLLGDPDTGLLVGASVQAGVGVVALLVAPNRVRSRSYVDDARPSDVVKASGHATSVGGSEAITGIRRPGGKGRGSARVTNSGDAIAHGQGSRAVSGIDYS
jgi:hypothetical protein